jgi:phenylalanyl-tRNA synthetase beta chain
MLKTVVENLKRGNNAGRIFELGNVYLPKQLPVTELPDEQPHVGFAAFGDEEDFFTVKGAVEALGDAFGLTFDYERATDVPYLHPGISAYLLCQGERVGVFGKLANEVTRELDLPKDSKENHKIFLGELDYTALQRLMPGTLRYQPISEFPEVHRDLSLVVEEDMACGALTAEIRNACKQVTNVELFDIYRGKQIGEGKKSMSFNITFAAADKALEPKDVDRFIKKILGNLKHRLGVEMR